MWLIFMGLLVTMKSKLQKQGPLNSKVPPESIRALVICSTKRDRPLTNPGSIPKSGQFVKACGISFLRQCQSQSQRKGRKRIIVVRMISKYPNCAIFVYLPKLSCYLFYVERAINIAEEITCNLGDYLLTTIRNKWWNKVTAISIITNLLGN